MDDPLFTRRVSQELKLLAELKWLQFEVINLHELHVSFRGLKDSDYQDGIYHIQIVLPKEYPLKAPDIIFMNESGRFIPFKRICLNFSSFHPEAWTPSVTLSNLISALRLFMLVDAPGVGCEIKPSEIRKSLAKRSTIFYCSKCKMNHFPLKKTLVDLHK
ncbi:unnamed protein product [Aduncisulcus paluster]|uniref:Unnamed protein product n=1 Tax=Aduncisulcus paluster TaxID=2918883 RepID=A0ABQ5K0Y6_9EUKA|nr:unnamed protein product [Aduncisulcus paluster]